MTTELQVLRADDLCEDNDVLCLGTGSLPATSQVAGAVWLLPGIGPRVAHQQALEEIARLASERLPGYRFWLLACQSSWQPDSRVLRRRKLWGSLATRGLTIPAGRKLPENLLERPEGVRYFGALLLDFGSLVPALTVVHAEPASHIVILRAQDEAVAETLARSGWDRPSFGPSMAIVSVVCPADGVVLWPAGAFDDREAGTVALARKELVDQLVRDEV